jgi:hypothetical protein
MAFGPALSATEYALVFGSLPGMHHPLDAFPGRHHIQGNDASLRRAGGGLRLLAHLRWRTGGFVNPSAPRRTDVLGGLACLSPGLSWASIHVVLASRCTVFTCSLTGLGLDPFRGKLATQNIGQNAPGAYLRSRFDGSDR